MRKKLFLTSAAILWAVTAMNSVHAATDVQKVIDETYVQPEYVLGSSLSEDQKNQTLKKLGYNASTDTKELKTMTPDVYSKIMNVAKAAPIPVTGESALAGIYYSLEANGAKVPQANKDLAQEELKALSDINAENKDKSGYDANKLNVALADIKSGLAKAKESKGNLTEEDIRKIVEDTLKNYKLDQVITGNQINIIINFALNLSKSDILSNADFTKTLNDLKQSIVSQAGDSFKNINLNFDADKALEDGGNFLSSLWQALVNFFKSFGS